MKASDFDFQLPNDRIAQVPAPDRDGSRLLVLDRAAGRVSHRAFRDLPAELAAGDLVVLNDTEVIPARLHGRKPTGGKVQVLLCEPLDPARPSAWRALVTSSKSLAPGSTLALDGGLTATLIARDGDAWHVELGTGGTDPYEALRAVGSMPLPPYIERVPNDPRAALDRERYQTVFARAPGAVAAPTAGLHLTEGLLATLRDRGIGIACVTLHVGLGTFLPLRGDDVASHVLHEEPYDLPGATADAIDATRSRQGRVVAVGTTVARTLETCAANNGTVRPGRGRSRLFIYPGHRFRVVDALVTNFHLPRSTLLMLVCALAGTERTLAAYREAVAEGYRFYSYGDAMLVR